MVCGSTSVVWWWQRDHCHPGSGMVGEDDGIIVVVGSLVVCRLYVESSVTNVKFSQLHRSLTSMLQDSGR